MKKPPKMTQNKLAKTLGISRQSLWNHIKRRNGAPPVDDLEGWRTYLAAVGRTGSAPTKELREQIARQKLGILKETRHSKARENRIQDGEVLEAVKVNTFIRNLISLLFAELDRMIGDLPTVLKGKDELAIEQECAKRKWAIKDAITSKHKEGVR
jgi:hypothetical protein